MRPIFQCELFNGPCGDPGLYVDFIYDKRALLIDLGDLSPLSGRKLLRTTHVFVTHAHMDHFIGFDHLLRVCVGRPAAMHLFGPPGFVDQVEHRIAGYTWNLVKNYATNFTITATELALDGAMQSASFQCQRAFAREPLAAGFALDGVLVDETSFCVRATVLDHQIPCLAFAIEEKGHVNVWKNRLAELDLPVGPWLRELKHAVARGDADDTPFRVTWRANGETRERAFALGDLRRQILQIVPGQRIGYVTDVLGNAQNTARIVALMRDADLLYIETVFLDRDAEHAARKFHLTARQAGAIAREANVRAVMPFHISPRYAGMEASVVAEMQAAFAES